MSSLPDINRICAIIDLCGDQIGSSFHVREMAIASTDRRSIRPVSRQYDFRPYGMQYFFPRYRTQVVPQVYHMSEVDDHIKSIYESMVRPGKDVMSFKGGQCEKVRLASLNIPHCNLEDYGCPRYEVIKTREHVRRACGYHKANRLHCPRAEVLAFKDWLLRRQRNT